MAQKHLPFERSKLVLQMVRIITGDPQHCKQLLPHKLYQDPCMSLGAVLELKQFNLQILLHAVASSFRLECLSVGVFIDTDSAYTP